MKNKAVEPELLRVFRWLVSARLVFLLLGLVLKWLPGEPRTLRYPLPAIVESTFLLGYLSWPWLRARLGRAFLPPALLVASAGPIFEQALTVVLRLRAGVPAATVAQDMWLLFFVLAVPLILTSWHYNLIAVAAFCASTAILDMLLYLPLAVVWRIRYVNVLSLTFVRSLLFALVGYVIVRLVRGQREQQASLKRANARLARYATTLEQLTVSRERNRLARELHDTLAHTLSAVAVQLEAARSLWESKPGAAREMLEQALASTRGGLGEARGAIHALRADRIEDLGLALAIRDLARSAAARADLSLELHIPESVSPQGMDLDPAVEQTTYRIADEALANAVRHARARDLLVCLERSAGELKLTVADDGQGFDTTLPPPEGHYGLLGMRERADLVGGTLTVQSTPGKGTTVQFNIEVGA
jgi:signal transduction histidine kinase